MAGCGSGIVTACIRVERQYSHVSELQCEDDANRIALTLLYNHKQSPLLECCPELHT